MADRRISDRSTIDDRVASVTGASSGSGVVSARALAEAGAETAQAVDRYLRVRACTPLRGRRGCCWASAAR